MRRFVIVAAGLLVAASARAAWWSDAPMTVAGFRVPAERYDFRKTCNEAGFVNESAQFELCADLVTPAFGVSGRDGWAYVYEDALVIVVPVPKVDGEDPKLTVLRRFDGIKGELDRTTGVAGGIYPTCADASTCFAQPGASVTATWHEDRPAVLDRPSSRLEAEAYADPDRLRTTTAVPLDWKGDGTLAGWIEVRYHTEYAKPDPIDDPVAPSPRGGCGCRPGSRA